MVKILVRLSSSFCGLAFAASLGTTASGQGFLATSIGEVDLNKRQVTVTVTNTAKRVATAYAIRMFYNRPDGTQAWEQLTRDFSLAYARVPGLPERKGPGPLNPGETRNETMPLLGDTASGVEISAVVFEDLSTEGDIEALRVIADHRAVECATKAEILTILTRNKASGLAARDTLRNARQDIAGIAENQKPQKDDKKGSERIAYLNHYAEEMERNSRNDTSGNPELSLELRMRSLATEVAALKKQQLNLGRAQ